MRTAALAVLVLLAGFGAFVLGGLLLEPYLRLSWRMVTLAVAALAFAVVLGVVAF